VLGKNAIAIVKQVCVLIFKSDGLAQLLQRPSGTGMSSDVAMDAAPAVVLVPHPMTDSHSPSDESALVVQQEWAVGRAATSAPRRASIPLGAIESASRDVQLPAFGANRRGVTLESGRSAWLHRSVEASRHARCRAQAVAARTNSRPGSTNSIERRAVPPK
jgi:hypothetical protein